MKKKLIIAASVLAMLLIIQLIFYIYRQSTRNAVQDLIIQKKTINVLIAGSNRYRDNRHRFFAVLSINPDKSTIGITFIPPEFRIRLDDRGKKFAKISEIDFGDFNKIRDTLKTDLKLNVPFFVELYSPDVERVVNLIEGINLYAMDQIKDMSNLKAGVNYMDGKKTVRFINSVDQNSIYQKYDRIQDIVMTLYHTKNKYKAFLTLPFISEIIKNIKTNMLSQEILKIGEIVYNDVNCISTLLPGTLKDGFYVMDEIAYKIYEKDFLSALVTNMEIDAAIKIKLLNGTPVPGLARKMRNILIRDGLNVIEFGTSEVLNLKKSIIIGRKGNYWIARRVSRVTGIQKIHFIIDNTQLYNTLIMIGEDNSK